MSGDHVDNLLEQWARERPDLDTSPAAITGRLYNLVYHLRKMHQRKNSAFGFGGSDFDVLATLRRSGPPYSLTPTELIQSAMITSGAMSNRIDHLEARGLVVRTPDEDDRRGVHVTLTPRGLAVIDAAVTMHYTNEQSFLEPLNEAERATLAGLLRRLLEPLEDGTIEVPEALVFSEPGS